MPAALSCTSGRALATRRAPFVAQASSSPRPQAARPAAHDAPGGSRREALLAGAAMMAALGGARPPAAVAAATQPVPVGTYLPAAGEGLVLYTPDAQKTPAIRAGVIKPSPGFYSFALPADFNEAKISNTLTGNFCMPRCDEPWVEALYTGPGGSKVQLWVVYLFRLVSKAGAKLADVGTPRQTIDKIGYYITGSEAVEEEDIVDLGAVQRGGAEFYQYIIDAPSGHHLATFTVKGDLGYLLTTTVGRGGSEAQLRKVIESLKA